MAPGQRNRDRDAHPRVLLKIVPTQPVDRGPASSGQAGVERSPEAGPKRVGDVALQGNNRLLLESGVS